MATSMLVWKGPQVLEELTSRVSRALDQIDLQIEASAKAELYPGHGKITGTLQRSIQTIPARRIGMRVVGGVKTAGVPYAALINRRYHYMEQGLAKARPSFAGLMRKV